MKHIRLLAAAALFLVLTAVPSLVFFFRSPVLVVTDTPFIALYGAARIKRQQVFASLALFRLVKPVLIADGASPDIIIAAINTASPKPFCVIFPRNHAVPAERYHRESAGIPTVLIGGLAPNLPAAGEDGFFCVYGTDRNTDLYRAGLMAGILGGIGKPSRQAEEEAAAEQRTVVLFTDRFVHDEGKELFLQGVREQDPELAVLFVSVLSQMPEPRKIACTVLTGAGAEYLERDPRMPVILFSWLDSFFTAREIMVVFDDSSWAVTVSAVRMAVKKQGGGNIPSKPLIFPAKITDNDIFRELKKSAEKNIITMTDFSGVVDKD